MERIQRIGRAATWLTVAVMASVTTAGVVLLAVGMNSQARQALMQDSPVLIIAGAAYLLAITPWWALAAVLGRQPRLRESGR